MRHLAWLGALVLATACLDVAAVRSDDGTGGAVGVGGGGASAGTGSGGAGAGGGAQDAGPADADAGEDVVDATTSPCGTPKLLDDFNRPDGPPGQQWVGQTDVFAVAGNQLTNSVGSSGVVGLFFVTALCEVQHAFVTLSHIDTATQYTSLVLKAQDTGTCNRLTVAYSPANKAVQIWTCAGGNWKLHKEWPRQLMDGDTIAADADENGLVTVRVSGTLLGSQSVSGWPFASAGGRIGLTVWKSTGSSRFDDFGGG